MDKSLPSKFTASPIMVTKTNFYKDEVIIVILVCAGYKSATFSLLLEYWKEVA